ncbi:MAG: GYD domain-containing protein [Rhizobiaceae bacterium]
MTSKSARSEAVDRVFVESMGGNLHTMYFCFGSEDIVAIIEAPDDETAA